MLYNVDRATRVGGLVALACATKPILQHAGMLKSTPGVSRLLHDCLPRTLWKQWMPLITSMIDPPSINPPAHWARQS